MDYDHIFGETLVRPPWEYVHWIRKTNSYLEKAKYVQQAIDENNWVFIDGLKNVVNPLYRVDFPVAFEKVDTYAIGFTWKQLRDLDDRLCQRKVVGNLRHELVKEAMEYSNKTVWNEWFRHILNHNLHLQFNFENLNKVLIRNDLEPVQTFHPQQSYEVQSKPNNISGDRIIDYKPSGSRLAILAYPGEQCIAFGQNGAVVSKYTNLMLEYQNYADVFLKEPVVFDGDVLSEEYHELQARHINGNQLRVNDAVHYVYDIIPWAHYLERRFDQPLEERRRILESNIQVAHEHGYLTSVKLIKYIRMTLNTSTGENMDKLEERLERAIQWGHEGLMIKNPAKPYKCARSSDWLKMRKKISVVLTIDKINLYPCGKRLYSVSCSGIDNDRQLIVNVARGFPNSVKQYFVENNKSVIGKHIEVQGINIQYSREHKRYCIILPCFGQLRPDLDQDEENTDADDDTAVDF